MLIGSIYVVLAMGMASVHYALALRNLVREQLPHHGACIAVLPRMNGTLVFRAPTCALREPRNQGSTQSGLTFLMTEGGQPRFRLALNTGSSLSNASLPCDKRGTPWKRGIWRRRFSRYSRLRRE